MVKEKTRTPCRDMVRRGEITLNYIEKNPKTRSMIKRDVEYIRYIVLHWTACPGATAKNIRDYFNRGSDGRFASAHYVIGLTGEIIECIPVTELAYHCGSTYAYKPFKKRNMGSESPNISTIGIELCHESPEGEFNSETIVALVPLLVSLCLAYNLDPFTAIIRHFDIVRGKRCPLWYCDHLKDFNKLKEKVDEIIMKRSNYL